MLVNKLILSAAAALAIVASTALPSLAYQPVPAMVLSDPALAYHSLVISPPADYQNPTFFGNLARSRQFTVSIHNRGVAGFINYRITSDNSPVMTSNGSQWLGVDKTYTKTYSYSTAYGDAQFGGQVLFKALPTTKDAVTLRASICVGIVPSCGQ